MTIVPALLERGDLFCAFGSKAIYRVLRLDGNYVYYCHASGYNTLNGEYKLSMSSKMRCTLIEDGDFDCPPSELHKHILIVPENSLA